MGRKILFRGKRINGEWVYGDLIQLSEVDDYWYILPTGVSGEMYERQPYPFRENDVMCEVALAKVKRATVGQYTGLTDKNKNMIFEGDILKWDRIEWGGDFNEVARFDYEQLDMRKNDWHEWCEIIGNIHDNPDLPTPKD